MPPRPDTLSMLVSSISKRLQLISARSDTMMICTHLIDVPASVLDKDLVSLHQHKPEGAAESKAKGLNVPLSRL